MQSEIELLSGPRINRRDILRLGAAAGLGISLAGFGGRVVADEDKGLLKVIHVRHDQDWSPLRGGGGPFRWNSLWWAAPMYFDGDGNIHPYVFAEWSSDPDYRQWTFSIAPNATFSDGSPITAADVKQSWELCASPATKNQRIDQLLSGVVGYEAASAGQTMDIEGITATDAASVQVRLVEPDPIFFMRIANHIAPITKASQSRGADGAEISGWYMPENGAVFSGPFKLVAIDLDAGTLAFEPNENFFGPEPRLRRIEFTSIDDPVAATLLLKSGDFQAHTNLLTSTIVQDLGPEFVAGPLIPTSQHFWFNLSREPMDDPKVRQALILAVDRDGLMQASYPNGPNEKADQILNSVPGARDSGFEPYPFDPDKARKLLAESRYKSPQNLPKLLMMGISGTAIELAAQYIAEQWRQHLGIEFIDMKPQLDSYSGPDQNRIQIFRDDVGTRVPDAVAYLANAIASTSPNAQAKLGGYKNDEIDALLMQAALKAPDDPQRIALAQQAQRLFRDEWAFIPWCAQTMSRMALKQVKGIDKNLDWQVIAPWTIEIT